MVSSLVLISTVLCVGKVYTASVDSCPMYGCRPSGTFSYTLKMTSNVGMAWPRSFIQGPLTNSLGCAANNVNIVCQAKGLQHEGYTTLNPDTGMASWYGDVLKKPTLPLMDISGDVIGTDGHNLVMFEPDGKIVKPQINLQDKLYPTYSLAVSEETGIIAIVSRQGLLVTYESNGVPHAAIQFRAEEQRTNGTFLPVAPPVVSGHRIYILTEFRPDYDTQEPNILGMQRLFAIDMKNALDGRLEIAWVYNFENLDPVLPLVGENHQEKRGTPEETRVDSTYGPAPQIMVNSNTNMVYVNLPPPEGATNAPHLLWGFKDEVNGTSPNLIFKIPQSLSNFAMFESNSGDTGADKLKRKDNSLKLSKNAGEASIWGVSINKKQILKLSPKDGAVVEQINLDSVLNMTSSTVTSKLIVARSSESSPDILIFGVQASSSNTDNSKNSTNNNSKMATTQNYVVSLIEKTVNWVIKTPNNREVKGQIAGIRRSAVNEADMLVVYTSDSEESEIFGITSY